MNLRDKRSLIAAAIGEALPTNYTVVIEPDHPLLLKGPDLLVGGEGNLWLFLIPTARENRSAHQLTQRFALCRWALPRHACFILATGGEEYNAIGDQAEFEELLEVVGPDDPESIVDAVLQLKDLTEIRSVMLEAKARMPELPLDVAVFLSERFTLNYRFSLAMVRRHERTTRRSGRSDIPEQLPASREGHVLLQDVEVTRFKNQRPSLAPVYALMIKAGISGYDFREGVPYPRRSFPRIALVKDFPMVRGDPYKALRAAAFANLSFIPEERADQLNQIIERIHERGVR